MWAIVESEFYVWTKLKLVRWTCATRKTKTINKTKHQANE
jgi:hypothetical protein